MDHLRRLAAIAVVAGIVAGCTGDDAEPAPGPDGTDATEEAEGFAQGTVQACAAVPDEPYAHSSEEGLDGLAIAVLRSIADDRGLDLEARAVEVAGTGAGALEEGCEVVVVTAPAAALIADGVTVSEPYLDVDQSLLVRSSDVSSFATLVGLRGQPIGSVAGTTGEQYLDEHLPEGAAAVAYPDLASAVDGLRNGQVAALVGESPLHEWLAAGDPSLASTQVITTGEQFAFVVAADDHEGRAELDGAISELRASGRLDDLYDRYVAAPAP